MHSSGLRRSDVSWEKLGTRSLAPARSTERTRHPTPYQQTSATEESEL
jgi:hypothetical protein